MTRNLKALGLALLATFAMSAIAASAASANIEVTTATTPAFLTGHSVEPELNITDNKVKCETGTFEGTITESPASSVRVVPQYEGDCTLDEQTEVTVTNNGCEYVLYGDTDVNGDSSVDVDCNHEGSITIADHSELCVIHIGDTHANSEETVNQGLTGVTYHTEGSGSTADINVTAEVTGIAFEATNFCGLLGIPSTGTDAEYIGDTTVKAYEDEAHTKQIALTDHEA